MKKVITLLSLLLVMVPSVALAHTGLLESNPTEGQIITEEVKDIELTFKGHIQTLSKMVLDQDRKEFEWVELKKEDTKMIGILAEPLENGSYVVKWTIIGEDGHPVEGTVSFSVQREDIVKEEVEEEAPVAKEEPKTEKEEVPKISNDEDHTSNFKTISLIVLGVLFVGIILTLFTKGKKKDGKY